MHARIISDCDFQTIHLKIIITKKAFFVIMIELFFGDMGPVRCASVKRRNIG